MKTLSRFRFLPLLVLVLAAGCEDLGLGTGGSEVTSLTIEDQLGNTLVTVSPVGTVSGSIVLARNAQRTLNIQLLSTAGAVQPGTNETVRVSITNSQLATWSGGTSDAGILRAGATAGSTTMRIDLLRAGSVVYSSPSIPVQVT